MSYKTKLQRLYEEGKNFLVMRSNLDLLNYKMFLEIDFENGRTTVNHLIKNKEKCSKKLFLFTHEHSYSNPPI